MYSHKVTNPVFIEKLLKKVSPQDIRELVLQVADPEILLDDLLDNIHNSDWPQAVPSVLIVDQTDDDACRTRARSILNMVIDKEFFGLRVLDFGCGTGHIATEIAFKGANVVAYDPTPSDFWKKFNCPEVKFTSDWSEVDGKFDVIIMYDVLDHVMDREPSKVLEECAAMLNDKGTIHVRLHPWICKHGSGLYTTLNKAWAHVIFPEEKLLERGYKLTPTRKVIHPMLTYKNWVNHAKLKIVSEDKMQEPVEDYFLKNELLKSLIQRNYKDSPMQDYKEGRGDLARVMSFRFVDLVLSR